MKIPRSAYSNFEPVNKLCLQFYSKNTVCALFEWKVIFDTEFMNIKGWTLFWGHHTSVDSSAPTILLSQVRIPSTPSLLLPFKVRICTTYICHCVEKRAKINKKRSSLAHFLMLDTVSFCWTMFWPVPFSCLFFFSFFSNKNLPLFTSNLHNSAVAWLGFKPPDGSVGSSFLFVGPHTNPLSYLWWNGPAT